MVLTRAHLGRGNISLMHCSHPASSKAPSKHFRVLRVWREKLVNEFKLAIGQELRIFVGIDELAITMLQILEY